MADIAGKTASKMAEAAGGAVAGAAVGSIIPGVGTVIGGALGGVAGGMGADALVDWLRGFLKQPEIELLLDPAKTLTNDFLVNLAQSGHKQRVVLMLDTFEQMGALEDWTCDVARRLHTNVLFVVAGRALPNWSRAWPSWMAHSFVEELKPMPEDVMRELISRYYATIHGDEPNPTQVEAIIQFARGLPIVITSAVQLWVKYGVEDFQVIRPEIVANLVDRLMEGVPKELAPVLETAAVVRWFDQPILRATLGQPDVRDSYNELRRFPFVRTRLEGFALHDAVREIMDENLRAHDAERHCELHERAAAYFERRLEKVTGEEAVRLVLERLYHRICANEATGIKLFQELAEGLVRYRLVSRLRALLNDVATYPLGQESSRLWLRYYQTALIQIEGRRSDAVKAYQRIAQNENAEPKLQAYTLCEMAYCLRGLGQHAQATALLEQSLRMVPIDAKLALSLASLGSAYLWIGEFDKSHTALERARDFFATAGDSYGLVFTLNRLRHYYLNRGYFLAAWAQQQRAWEILRTLSPEPLYLKMEHFGTLAIFWAWCGRLKETEEKLREAFSISQRLNLEKAFYVRELGYVIGQTGRFTEAENYFQQAIAFAQQMDPALRLASHAITAGYRGAILSNQGQLREAEAELMSALPHKLAHDILGAPEVLIWLGELAEIKAHHLPVEEAGAEAAKATSYYQQAYGLRKNGSNYFECWALTGLVRVGARQENDADIAGLSQGASKSCQKG